MEFTVGDLIEFTFLDLSKNIYIYVSHEGDWMEVTIEDAKSRTYVNLRNVAYIATAI